MAAGFLDTDELLRRNPAFRQLDAEALAAVAGAMSEYVVRGGDALFTAHDPADALYILKSGALGLYRTPHAGGSPHLAGIISDAEAVGTLGLLMRQQHVYTVRALRDSVVLELSRHDFRRLTRRHPKSMLVMAQLALERLLRSDNDEAQWQLRSFAVLPHDRSIDARDFADRLCAALAPFGAGLVIDAALGRGRDVTWFAQRESEVRFVFYVDDHDAPGWRELCRRQADALLLVADAGAPATPWLDHSQIDAHAARERPRYLLLEQPAAGILPGSAQRWRAALEGRVRHHHLRNAADLARLARLLAQRSRGLVLSGGGARGFAAIGVIRALREAKLEFDAVGGTSIGAIVGAGVACQWDDAAMHAICRRAFVDHDPLADWTLPLVALHRGGCTSRLLREAFGDRDIEDLPLPFFCVSANLTRGVAQVHRGGPLWLWLRASSAVPGVLPPVLHDGQVFVDGAVINNLPTDVMADDALAEIVAIDIDTDDALRAQIEGHALPGIVTQWRQRRLRPDLLSILLRAGMVNAESAAAHRRELASQCLTPCVAGVGLLEWSAFDRVVEAGYRYACEALERAAKG